MRELSEAEMRKLVETVARRVAERVAAEEASSDRKMMDSMTREGQGGGGMVLPCAIPPVGSPRYEAVMKALEK